MCHLYDIDSDLKPIKHAQFKHDSVQGAMATAQAECLEPIWWIDDSGIITGFINSLLSYQIIE